MHNQIPEKLAGLLAAVKDSKAAIIEWLQMNLASLSQEDLLCGVGFSCPCGSCHASQFWLLQRVFKTVERNEFKLLLKEQFFNNPHNVTLPEVAYILIAWMCGHDIQCMIDPFPELHPATGVRHIDTLSPSDRKRMEKHRVYSSAVRQMKAIVETLQNIGVSEKQLEAYQIHCHDRWLAGYKPQIASVKPKKPAESFDERFESAMQAGPEQFIRYFLYHQDREPLRAKLVQDGHRQRIPDIVRHIPESKVSWVKWGKRLMAEYNAEQGEQS